MQDLPFPEIEIPQSKPFNSAEMLKEFHAKEALRKAADEKLIEPWKAQMDLIYSQTNFIDVALDKMNKAGIPTLIRHTWYFLKVNESKKIIVVNKK